MFFLNKKDNLVIGPYKVSSNIFYNPTFIWQNKGGVDAYPYRVRLKSENVYAISGDIFSQIVEENNLRVDSADLGQRSVFTFLPKDNGIISNLLKQKGQVVRLGVEEKVLEEGKIDLKFAQSQRFTEAFLEFFILRKFGDYFKENNLAVYNQFRINLLGSKIDIIAVSEKEIVILELKKNKIGKKDIEQFKRYLLWNKTGKNLLEALFKVRLNESFFKGYIIGAKLDKNVSIVDSDIVFKKYSLENNQLSLSDG